MRKVIVWSRDHALLIFLVIALISGFWAYHARKIRVDASSERMMMANDPDRDFYKKVVETFGSDNVSIIYIKDDHIFDHKKLLALQDAVYALEEIQGVIRVNSFFSTTNFKGMDGILSTNKLIDEDVPEDPEVLEQIKLDALDNPLLLERMISKDGKVIAISVVSLNEKKENSFDVRLADEIDQIISPLNQHFGEVFQLGRPMIRRSVAKNIIEDQKFLIPVALFLILTLLIIGLKSFNGALIPILTGGISVLWTIGFMGMVDIPFQILTCIVPSLLLILGATEDMHIVSEYFEGIEEGHDKLNAIDYMAKKVSTAVTLTALTTVLGFLSIYLNDMVMLKEFGIVAAFGLLANFLITITVCPAYMKVFGEKKSPFSKTSQKGKSFYVKAADRLIDIIKGHRKAITYTCIFATAVSLFGMKDIKVDNDLLGYFKEDSPIRIKSNKLKEALGGSQSFYIILTAREKDAFKSPIHLKKITEIQDFIKNVSEFASSISLSDQIALINREMEGGDDSQFRVPEKGNLISQYLLFLTRDDLEGFVSADYKQANINVTHNLTSSFDLTRALGQLEIFLDRTLLERILF